VLLVLKQKINWVGHSYFVVLCDRLTDTRKRVKGDLLTSIDGGFPSLWLVAKQYQITNGLLHRSGRGVARTYKPFSEEGLPNALARVSSKEISPLEFASEFGELGYSQIVNAASLPSFSACLPKVAEWKAAYVAYRNYRDAVSVAERNLPQGDPVDWLIAHSKTVALCLDFIGLLSEGDEHEIREAVERVTPRGYAMRDRIITLPVEDWRGGRKAAAPSVILRQMLCDLITENVAGVRRWLITDPFGSRADSLFSGQSMIEAVYWQLADKMGAGMIRRCAECQRFFVARDKRVQYCPPLPGATRSRCSSRLNVQNFRARKSLR
jgi:hypothetical protein